MSGETRRVPQGIGAVVRYKDFGYIDWEETFIVVRISPDGGVTKFPQWQEFNGGRTIHSKDLAEMDFEVLSEGVWGEGSSLG